MNVVREVSPVSGLTGMSVLSLATGNRLGHVLDLLIDPINGVPLGVVLSSTEAVKVGLPLSEIYNFGRDAIMATSEKSVSPLDAGVLSRGLPASNLIGTRIITESGDVLGQITNIFVTLKPPPHVLYEARQSILDKLLGREFFLPASLGHALSDDCARLVVPDVTSEIASPDLATLLDQQIEVRSFDPASPSRDYDDTIVMESDEDETLVRIGDDEDTVLRHREPTGSQS